MRCRLTVRASEGEWQGEVDEWTALVVLASLSAEPESLDELTEAVRRYQPEHRLFDPPRPAAGNDDAPAEGPWCLIDLAGRTVVAGGGFELPDPHGAYEADDGDDVEGFPVVWLDTPEDWLFREVAEDWRAVVTARAAARAATPRPDARAVLFGRPLLGHLAHGVLSAACGPVDEARRLERTRAIHADWLMTARDDLGGWTPRELLLAERGRLARDLERRAQQWSMQGFPPPALPRDSLAYRRGGFGTAEVVYYFDLVRALLAEAWRLAEEQPRPPQAVLVERLAESRDDWLQGPDPEMGAAMTPAAWIESERRRLPVAGHAHPIEDDCPLCQAMADGEFGPGFVWFDGHHLELEDVFAFSLCRTREEWERKQEEYRQFSEKMDREWRERAEGGEAADPDAGSVWQTSFVDWDALTGEPGAPLDGRLALGFLLAELTAALQDRPGGPDLVQSLNAAYRGLRASQDAVATELAAQEFRDVVEVAARQFPDLTARCADLQSKLDEVLRTLA